MSESNVLAFFDNLLVSQNLSIGPITVTSLAGESLVRAEAEIVNAGFQRLAVGDHVDERAWAQRFAGSTPIAVASFGLDETEAEAVIARGVATATRLADLLTLHRGARGRLMATYVKLPGTLKGRLYRNAGAYAGNLVGGFIAGEDSGTLTAHWESIARFPLLAHWLALFAAAQTETDMRFVYARYWLVLELMAEALVARPRAGTGRPRSARAAWARVHDLIEDRSKSERGMAWISPTGNQDLWETTGIWYGYRHAAVHYGGFDPSSPSQARRPWFDGVKHAFDVAGGQGASGSSRDPYLSALIETVKILLHWELDAASGFFDPGEPTALGLKT